MSSADGADAWLERFTLHLECKRCGERIESGHISPSLFQTAPGTRVVVVTVPEVCTSCRSLRVVK